MMRPSDACVVIPCNCSTLESGTSGQAMRSITVLLHLLATFLCCFFTKLQQAPHQGVRQASGLGSLFKYGVRATS